MKEYTVLASSKMFSLYDVLNTENLSDCKAIALREIDISALDRIRQQNKTQIGKLSYTSFVAKAIAMTLEEMPQANRIAVKTFFFTRLLNLLKTHISVAVERNDLNESSGGAFIYTIYDTNKKSLHEITNEISGLSEKPLSSNDHRLERWQRIKQGVRQTPFIWIIQLVIWLQRNIPNLYIKNRGGAAMISSPSKYGVDCIIANWPYTIGVSFGLAKNRPWVENNELVIRKTMMMTLSFDRRIISGAIAARFMNRLCEILEQAETFFT